MLYLTYIRKIIYLAFICIAFSACNGQVENKETQNQLIQKHIILSPFQSESPVMIKLRDELKKKQFALKTTNLSDKLSFINCEKQEQITFDHVVTFFARRSFPEKGSTLYPDFKFYVLEFDNELTAKEIFEKLKSMKSSFSHESDSFKECEAELLGKAPYVFAQNGKQVFYFNSRAEAFRGYINQYSQLINVQI